MNNRKWCGGDMEDVERERVGEVGYWGGELGGENGDVLKREVGTTDGDMNMNVRQTNVTF